MRALARRRLRKELRSMTATGYPPRRRAACGCLLARLSCSWVSVAAANTGEIVACGASIRPVSQVRGVVRVQIAGPHELVVYAQRGATQISYRGETETIAEVSAYRVRLNVSDDGGQGGAIAKSPAHSGKLLVMVAIGVGAATAVGVALALSGKQGSV